MRYYCKILQILVNMKTFSNPAGCCLPLHCVIKHQIAWSGAKSESRIRSSFIKVLEDWNKKTKILNNFARKYSFTTPTFWLLNSLSFEFPGNASCFWKIYFRCFWCFAAKKTVTHLLHNFKLLILVWRLLLSLFSCCLPITNNFLPLVSCFLTITFYLWIFAFCLFCLLLLAPSLLPSLSSLFLFTICLYQTNKIHYWFHTY